jgi:N-glycosylase/DNA lyase
MTRVCEIALRGAGGEPISFARTVYSHGCAQLAPASVSSPPLRYRRTFRIDGRIVDVTMRERSRKLLVETDAPLRRRQIGKLGAAAARMFRFDADLSAFYALVETDDTLAWAASGAGRILASPSVFEDVIKTICTTNCAWSATIRMTQALAALGEGAFPEPGRLAATDERWFGEVARMGYRGAYVLKIARAVANGELDLERLRDARRHSDAEVEESLLALPGIGPYGAAHVMQLLGRHRALVLDSWTRPKYLAVSGRKRAADSTIRRSFARYGAYAGLAFWLYLTRDWVDE